MVNQPVVATVNRNILYLKPRLAPLVFLASVYLCGTLVMVWANVQDMLALAIWGFFAIGIIWFGKLVYQSKLSIEHNVTYYDIPAQYVHLDGNILSVRNMPIVLKLSQQQVVNAQKRLQKSQNIHVTYLQSDDLGHEHWVYDNTMHTYSGHVLKREQQRAMLVPEFYIFSIAYQQKNAFVKTKYYTPSHVEYMSLV